jgi:hypothetical protein
MLKNSYKKSAATLGVVAGLLTAAVPAGAAVAPVATSTGGVAAAGATSQGIIMRDGGVCDPIRHMGC